MIKDILVTGCEGMVGRAVVKVLSKDAELRVHPYSHHNMDITYDRGMRYKLRGTNFSWWINCAAFTNVDKAETDYDEAQAINSFGPQLIAMLCRSFQIRLIHMSTDMVFNDPNPYGYNEYDPTPKGSLYSRYGQTKLAGENAVLFGYPEEGVVVRTSAVYGPTEGRNFPKSIIAAHDRKGELIVTNQEIVKPTFSEDIADSLLYLINNWTELVINKRERIFHAVPDDFTSRFDQAKYIGSYLGFDNQVLEGEFERKIKMNPFSLLNNTRLPQLPSWKFSTWKYLDMLKNELTH